MDGKLCRTVERKVREAVADELCDAKVLDYHSVGSEVIELAQELFYGRHFGIGHECVEGDVVLLPVLQAVGFDLADIFEREVHCTLAGGEALHAEIDGIGPAFEGVEGALEGPCGKVQFTDTVVCHFFSVRLQMAWNVSGLMSCSTLHASARAVSSETPIFMKNCVRTLCLV